MKPRSAFLIVVIAAVLVPALALCDVSISISVENTGGATYKISVQAYTSDPPVNCEVKIWPSTNPDAGSPLKEFSLPNCETEQSVSYTLPGNGNYLVTAEGTDKASNHHSESTTIEYDVSSGGCSSVRL